MRVIRFVVLVGVLSATSYNALQGQAPEAAQVIAAARAALGGEKNLASVKTFVATGRTRQIRGNNLVPIEFEITCELPDKFVRKDEIPAQDTDATVSGFNGDELVQFPPLPTGPARLGGPPITPGGRATDAAAPARGAAGDASSADGRGRGGVPPSPAQLRVVAVKQDFARLMLGVFAASFPSYPLTLRYAGQAEAPEGIADVLDVAGPANFSARFVVARETHLPVMLIWQIPATNVLLRIPGQPLPDPVPPGAVIIDAPAPPLNNANQEERDQYAANIANLRRQALAQAKPVEYRMYYADFRDVNGMQWPFRIRRAIAGETIEETTFDRVRINTKIDPRAFEAPK
jgi:hypothetical protein